MKKLYLVVLLIFTFCIPLLAGAMRIQTPDAVFKVYEKVKLRAFSNSRDILPAAIETDYLCMSGKCCEEPTLCTFISFSDSGNIEKANYRICVLDGNGEEQEVYYAFYRGQYIVEYCVVKGTALLLKALDSENEIVIKLED